MSLSVSPSRWNGVNTSSRRSAGIPGPRSTTRSSVRPRNELAASRTRSPSGAVAHRVREQVHDDALQQPGVGEHRPQVVGEVELHLAGAELELVERGEHDVGDVGRCERDGERARLQAAHVEQVRDELGERVEALGGGVEQFLALLGRQVETSGERSALIAADADVSGRRRSWPTAARSAERTLSVSASSSAASAALASAPCSIAGVELGGDDLQQAALGCLEVGSVQLEHAARADRGCSSPGRRGSARRRPRAARRRRGGARR